MRLRTAFLAGLLLLAACDDGGLRPRTEARPLAVVDGRTVTVADLAARVAQLPESQRPRDRAGLERLLAELVDVEVLAAEARRRGFERTPEARGAKAAVLSEAGLAAFSAHLPGPESFAAMEVERYYAEHRELFTTPEIRRLAAATFATRAEAERARRAPDTLAVGELGELVVRSGAVVGTLPPTLELPHPVVQAGLALDSVGAVSPPVEHEGRHWLVRLEGRAAEETRSLAREEGNIRRRMAQERYEAMRDRWLAEARAKTRVVVDDSALREVRATGDLEAYDPARWKSR